MAGNSTTVIMAKLRVEGYLQRFLGFYCKEYCSGKGFNVVFKATVNPMLIGFRKAEGSFCRGKCIISA